ncbi:MAG: heme exporter protein CcmD [Methylococcaceae bacterium]|jgi:heme exporter protein D|nr:heme exporter protein CcmD [Methylococcaceae bacterium]
MSQFLEMGGYAFYVWSAYGVSTLVLCYGLLRPYLDHKKTLREISLKRRQHKRDLND